MRVLLVEDEPNVAEAVTRGLSVDGIEVEWVADGRTGLERGLAATHDAIVLDVLLPGLNGFRVCSELRAAGVTTPVLMLTAKDGEYDEAEGLETGADDYLTKPFSFVVLRARLHALLRRSRGGATWSELRAGELSLDPLRRTCTRAGRPLSLTAREFDVLEHLVRNAGLVVSKYTLLDRVWGPEFEGGTNVVEVYVGYLRRKVDHGFDRPLIETVRNHGYRIAA